MDRESLRAFRTGLDQVVTRVLQDQERRRMYAAGSATANQHGVDGEEDSANYTRLNDLGLPFDSL